MIRAFVPRNDAAGHSESLNGCILPATAVTERVDFVEALAVVLTGAFLAPVANSRYPLSLVTAKIEHGRDVWVERHKKYEMLLG